MGGFKFAPSAAFERVKPSLLGKQKMACLKHQVCAILARAMGTFRLPTRPWRSVHTDPHIRLPTAALTTAFLLASCSSGLLSAAPSDSSAATAIGPVADTSYAYVDHVIDGDTIRVRRTGSDGKEQVERVRLEGIDSPEKTGGYLPAECFGDEATAYLRHLMPPGTPLYLEASGKEFDRYGRRLAFVYRVSDGRLIDKRSINRVMVDIGYAEAVDYGSGGDRTAQLLEAGLAAQKAGRGLWAEAACD